MSFQNTIPFFLGFVAVIIPYSLLFAINTSFLLFILHSLAIYDYAYDYKNITDNRMRYISGSHDGIKPIMKISLMQVQTE